MGTRTRIGIFIFLVLILTVFYSTDEGFSERTNSTKSDSGFKSLERSKIHPIITEWKSSTQPQVFASENNLQYSDGKIRVYLYLDDAESVSKLPTDIDLQSSSDNIVAAYVDGRQITQLSQLDFVQRIEPPVSVSFDPPQIPDNESIDEIFLYSSIAVIIAVIVAGIVIVSRRKIAKKI